MGFVFLGRGSMRKNTVAAVTRWSVGVAPIVVLVSVLGAGSKWWM
jgi:hypothetical protein